MKVTILGTGSAGNCSLVETDSTCIIVDAGLSARQITDRLRPLGRTIEQLDAILLTHEHSDHTRALSVLCKTKTMAVYANRLTAEAVADGPEGTGRTRVSWRLFSTGQPFTVGDFSIDSFSVPHDAYDPVGFVIRQGQRALGVVTDLGHATKLVTERIRALDALILESNHDVKLLQDDTARPWVTKQRIMSRHGHLSNDAAAALAGDVACERLRYVCLAHLSRDCNRPDLAQRVVADKLKKIGAHHVAVTVSTQDQPTATLVL